MDTHRKLRAIERDIKDLELDSDMAELPEWQREQRRAATRRLVKQARRDGRRPPV